MATENKGATPTSEAAPPKWLTTELIQTALRNDGETNCQVKNIGIHRATAPGDNYLSIIYRVKVELSDGTELGVLVKSLPDGEELVMFLENSKTFEREGEMLGDIIPRMQALLEASAPGRWKPMTARCLLHSSKFLVLEDLAPQGFRMANRLQGLGLRHCLLALRSLARFHASSHALLKKDPFLREKFSLSDTKPMEKMEAYMMAGIQGGANACKGWAGFEEYAERLEKLKDVFLDKMKEFYSPKPDKFAVISHGDFWTNNMMFRYDENGHPCDLKMVDLQISYLTPPAIDVIFFLGTSPHETVSDNYHDLLVREYYFALQEALAALDIKAPTLEDFLAEMDVHGIYWLFPTSATIPLIKTEKVADFDGAMAGDKEAIRVLFTRPLIEKWIQRVLPVLKRNGYLDV